MAEWPEGSYWYQLFNEFPTVHIRISRGFIFGYDEDGTMASTRNLRPEDERSAKLWDYLHGIKDLM